MAGTVADFDGRRVRAPTSAVALASITLKDIGLYFHITQGIRRRTAHNHTLSS